MTESTFVTFIEFETNTFPITFIDCCAMADPMFAVWIHAFAKTAPGAPTPETPVPDGWMIPVTVVFPVKMDGPKWYVVFEK